MTEEKMREILRDYYFRNFPNYCYGRDCDDDHCRCADYWVDEQMEKLSSGNKLLDWVIDKVAMIHSKIKMFFWFKKINKNN